MGLFSFTSMPSLSLLTIAIDRPREAYIYRVLKKSRRGFREGGQSVQPSDGEPEPPPQEEGVAGKGREGEGPDRRRDGQMGEGSTRDSTSK